jgi:probable HAF family extracellular repeat protein
MEARKVSAPSGALHACSIQALTGLGWARCSGALFYFILRSPTKNGCAHLHPKTSSFAIKKNLSALVHIVVHGCGVGQFRKERKMKPILFSASLITIISASVLGASYTITDLGVLTGTESRAYAINDYGQITGFVKIGSMEHAFIWADGTMNDIGTLGGSRCQGKGINNKGEVVGWSYTSACASARHAFVYKNGSMSDIGALINNGNAKSMAYAINDSGQIVGEHDETTNFCGAPQMTPSHAFLYDDGVIIDLGTLDGSYDGYSDDNAAYGINNFGQIVGDSQASDGKSHAFLYDKGIMTDLGAVGSLGVGWANGISDNGYIVGTSADITNTACHATLWYGSDANDIGTLGSDSSIAKSINFCGQIVGATFLCTSSDDHHICALVWENGTVYNLNNLVTGSSGWNLRCATGINVRGQITGWGTNPSGQIHGFLLNRVPEPGTYIKVQLDSSLNDSEVRIGQYSAATENFDVGMDIPMPQPRSNTIDFRIAASFDSPLDRLEQELHDANSFATFQCIISGEQLAGASGANLSFEILDPNNEDNFAEKEIFLDLCDPCDSPIASYNVKNLAKRGNVIPITVNNGMSYKLYFRFYDPEDIDRSRRVDFIDFVKVAENYMLTDANALNDYYGGADINRSGTIDLVEISLIAENWLNQH